jgi:integrase
MALFKRGNIWWMEITNQTGKKLRESTRTPDRSVAEKVQELRRLQLSINVEQHWCDRRQQASCRTWEEASARWLREHDDKRSAKDDRRYAVWWGNKIGDAQLSQLDADTLRRHLEAKKKETSASTANRHLSFLSAVLNAAVKEYGWLAAKPHLKKYREPKGVVRYLTVAEIERLLTELPNHHRDMVEFALATGLRQGAVKRLKWTAVNLEKRFCWVIPQDSKSGEPICVPLNETSWTVLSRCLGRHRQFVFTYRGQPIDQVNSRAWRQALKRAGIAQFRWHDLRHTWASHHAMNGTPVHVLQELGGWHDPKMVRRYAHLSPDALSRYVSNAAR